jgi:hypothetical protein
MRSEGLQATEQHHVRTLCNQLPAFQSTNVVFAVGLRIQMKSGGLRVLFSVHPPVTMAPSCVM